MEDDAATLAARAARAQDPTEGLRAVAELRSMIDDLEAHQVDRAMDRGWSWAQVGRSLGISKQAAHRRHASRPPVAVSDAPSPTPGTAEEPRVVITGEARAVVERARGEAAALGEGDVQPVHLLAALLQAPAGAAQDALLELGVDIEALRTELGGKRRRSKRFKRRPGISAATREVLKGSLGESQRLCHGHLGPEHLLLALLRDQDGPAVGILTRLGATIEDVETAVCDVLKHTDFARSL
jgi:hypothetical protein